jgi:cysteine dioxygenase
VLELFLRITQIPMEIASLQDLLSFLNQQDMESFRGNAIADYFTRKQFDDEQFLPYIFFREETYGRNLVAKSDLYELILITWLPGQRTPIHDHSGSRCWTSILTGELAFKNYQLTQAGTMKAIGGVERQATGNFSYIDDEIALHSIANASSKPAVSIHLYAEPITSCKIYDEAKKKMVWKELHYFTQYGEEWGEEVIREME